MTLTLDNIYALHDSWFEIVTSSFVNMRILWKERNHRHSLIITRMIRIFSPKEIEEFEL